MIVKDTMEKTSVLRIAFPDMQITNEFMDSHNVEILTEGDCKGKYIVESPDSQAIVVSVKNYISETEANRRKERGMIPKEYKDKRVSSFNWNVYNCDVSASMKMVNSFIFYFERYRADGMGLYIYSRTKGSGKTMLSCCILNELAYRYRVSFKFINILELFEITKKGYKGFCDEEKQIYGCSVLVIDDIGVQMAKEWTDSVLYRLINHRYNNKQVTIYTSNININNLNIDDRIADRIDSTSYAISLPEISIRSIKSKEKKKQIIHEIAEEKGKG